MTSEHPAAHSRRMTKAEAETAKALAVMEVRMDEIRRDLARLDGSHSAQLSIAAGKASEAVETARKALDEVRRQMDNSQPITVTTAPYGNVSSSSGRGREAAIVGTAGISGAGLYAVIEFIIRSIGH